MADPKMELNPVTVGFIDTGPTVSQRVPVTAANPLPVTLEASGGTSSIKIAALSAADDPFTKVTVNISTATTTHVVAGTAAQTVRVYRVVLNFAGTQTLDVKGTGGTSLVGAPMTFGTGGGLVLDFDGSAWWTTPTAEGLDFVTTTTAAVTGTVYYIKS